MPFFKQRFTINKDTTTSVSPSPSPPPPSPKPIQSTSNGNGVSNSSHNLDDHKHLNGDNIVEVASAPPLYPNPNVEIVPLSPSPPTVLGNTNAVSYLNTDYRRHQSEHGFFDN